MSAVVRVSAVFFDVDFTLIYPGPTFQGAGYQEFCARLLEHGKVAAVFGSAFGAEGYLRLSYATSDEILAKGVARLARFCASLKQ